MLRLAPPTKPRGCALAGLLRRACHRNGIAKHRTEIGKGAFIGSNTALVAPVKVGDGAVVGAGSTIPRDVAPDAIAVARSEQTERPGAAKRRKGRAGKSKGKG